MDENIVEVSESQHMSTILKNEQGEIMKYKLSQGYDFPCIIVEATDGVFQKYKLNTLKGMIGGTAESAPYMLYIRTAKGDLKAGRVSTDVIRILKTSPTFSNFNLIVYLDKDTYFDGDLVLAVT